MKKIILSSCLALSSFLFADSSDLACKEIPVSIYYAGYNDNVGEQKYVYFNGSAVLEITPPASYGEKKSISVITNDFNELPSISSNGVNIEFGTTKIDSSNAGKELSSLSSIPVSIYYAGYNDNAGDQKYVYFNGSAVLEITPPASYGEKKSISVITSDFINIPELSIDGSKLVFGSLIGETCNTEDDNTTEELENPPSTPDLNTTDTTDDSIGLPPQVPSV